MEISKEYLDAQFAQLSRDIGGIKESVDELARMVNNEVIEPFNRRFDELEERLDVREQVGQHARDIQEIKRTLKLA
jgi:phosphopantetheine adenylyltransferase